MGLSVKKMLDEYFSKEQVQDALHDIGETTSGNKEDLVQQLRNNWESYNRDIYELLDFTDKDYLQMICEHYNLDATPAKKDILKRRIKKANLLGSGEKQISRISTSNSSLIPKNKSKPETEITDVHFHFSSITQSKGGRIGSVLAIIGIAVTIIIAWITL